MPGIPLEDAVVGASATEGGAEAVDDDHDDDDGFRKDANDVLVKDGPERLLELIDNADPTPINGLYRFSDYYQDIMRYYDQDDVTELGVSTGWHSLDQYYKVVPGELTIVTGIPNSGKSEWIDALLTNLSKQFYWCFALCSLEKKPRDHAKQLIEKYLGKPFFNYINEQRTRMTVEELAKGMEWVEEHFHVIQHVSDDPPTIDWVLEVARTAVMRFGIRGLVIDPYNELDHTRPQFMSETEYVSHMLSKVKRFAQMYGVHVWFVAHPRQLQNWHGQPPTLYDISGSANFINKADNGIVVHRVWNMDKKTLHQGRPEAGKDFRGGRQSAEDRAPALAPNEVQILVRKVRNKAAGMVGNAVLVYDRPSGQYHLRPQDQIDPVDVDEDDYQTIPMAMPASVSVSTEGQGMAATIGHQGRVQFDNGGLHRER